MHGVKSREQQYQLAWIQISALTFPGPKLSLPQFPHFYFYHKIGEERGREGLGVWD